MTEDTAILLTNYVLISMVYSFKRIRKQSADYYVDCPKDICPGECFRVRFPEVELIVQCPFIAWPGERIVISLLRA